MIYWENVHSTYRVARSMIRIRLVEWGFGGWNVQYAFLGNNFVRPDCKVMSRVGGLDGFESTEMDGFAPRRVSIDGIQVEEFTSGDMRDLSGVGGGDQGRLSRGGGGRGRSGNGVGVEEGNTIQHALLVCHPCNEEVEEEVDEVVEEEVFARTESYIYDDEDEWERLYKCTQKGCRYKAKKRTHLKKHLAHVHDIGVVWHQCMQDGCEYKAKESSTLKLHLAYVHDIGVVWHKCTQDGCEYKAKQRSSIKQHTSRHHA